MTKCLLSSTALVLAVALATPASAQTTADAPPGGGCAPGSWFCAEPPPQQKPVASPSGKALQPLPDPEGPAPADDDSPPPPPPRLRRPPPPPAPPPVVVYERPPRPTAPPAFDWGGPPPPPPPPLVLSRPREWGLNLHVEGASFGHGAGDAGMAGAGFGVRYKPNRRFGIETDLDFVGGTDYQGDSRSETAFTINGLFFLNPRSRAQVYLLAGFGWSGAHVTNDQSSNGSDLHYTYFGGQLGAGLELRLSRAIALNGDVRGFIRTRIDDQAASSPEFVDQYGRTSNTSGGALFTGGMTIYF